MNTDFEEWDYKISGKTSGIASIAFGFVISVFLVSTAVYQLLSQPNKSKQIALFFGCAAAPMIYFFVISLIRYVCFRVYIGKKGFYFQSNPFNGKYYLYSDITRCYEYSEYFNRSVSKCYFFNFTDKNGKTVKFPFEKNIAEREINELKIRINAEVHPIDIVAVPQSYEKYKEDENKQLRKKLWTPIIVILIIAISSAAIYFARTEQYKDWVTAPGIILKIEQHSDSYRIYCSYIVNGSKYYDDYTFSGNKTELAKNDTVDIWYNPDDPSQSSFYKAGPGLDPFIPIIFGFPIVVGVFMIAKRRKNRLM